MERVYKTMRNTGILNIVIGSVIGYNALRSRRDHVKQDAGASHQIGKDERDETV